MENFVRPIIQIVKFMENFVGPIIPIVNFVGSIIPIVKFVGGPIVRYLKYQIKFNHHLEQFNASKEGLCSQKRDIESRLNKELHHEKVAKEEVQTWLEEAEKFIAREDIANEVNSWGCLSCCFRVKILDKRAQELKEIYDKGGSFANGCLVKDDPSVLGVELPTTKLQGREDAEAEILACLIGDEVTKLGVWGMGGVGKTTIMKHVHNKLLKECPQVCQNLLAHSTSRKQTQFVLFDGFKGCAFKCLVSTLVWILL